MQDAGERLAPQRSACLVSGASIALPTAGTRITAARNMAKNYFSTVFVVLAVLAAPANAAENSFGAQLLVCNACHGEKGVPKDATIPVIWGQQQNYLDKQLHDFVSGDRNSEVMSWMAKIFSPAELRSAAAYFAKNTWPARSAGAATTPPPDGVAVCEICHQRNLVGGAAGPRLAGQSYEYLVEAMRRFGETNPANNADMTSLMKAISPAEQEAMARYMSGL
jgi:cytochrome c553